MPLPPKELEKLRALKAQLAASEPAPDAVERSWITVVGRAPMAVINTLWAACEQEGCIPQRLVLLSPPTLPPVQDNVRVVKTYARVILQQFGVAHPDVDNDVSINEDDFLGFAQILRRTAHNELRQARRLVIDTTPGRKYMSAVALWIAQEYDRVEKAYYNLLFAPRYQGVVYPLIPRPEQRLYDLIEIFGRGGGKRVSKR